MASLHTAEIRYIVKKHNVLPNNKHGHPICWVLNRTIIRPTEMFLNAPMWDLHKAERDPMGGLDEAEMVPQF